MASKTIRKIASDLLVFLLLIGIVVFIGECVDRSLERKIDYDEIIALCVPFISTNVSINNTFGAPISTAHQKKRGKLSLSDTDYSGADIFLVNGTKSNGEIKVFWNKNIHNGFEIRKISIPMDWQDDTVIWTYEEQ